MTPEKRIDCVVIRKAAWVGRLCAFYVPTTKPNISSRTSAHEHQLTNSRSGKRAVLEVILENPRGQRGAHRLSLGRDGAHHFSAADDFGGGESGDFGGEDEVDFQLRAWLQHLFGFEQHSGTADIFRGAFVPIGFAEEAIAQWQVKVESLCARGGDFSRPNALAW